MIVNNNTQNNTNFKANVRTVGEIPEILNPAIAKMRNMFAQLPGTENDEVVFNIQECISRSGLKKPLAWLRYVSSGQGQPDNRECASIGELVERNEPHQYIDTAGEEVIKAANRLIAWYRK